MLTISSRFFSYRNPRASRDRDVPAFIQSLLG